MIIRRLAAPYGRGSNADEPRPDEATDAGLFSRSPLIRVLLLLSIASIIRAETGYDAWLRYAPAPKQNIPAVVSILKGTPILRSAQGELIRGIRGMTNRILRVESGVSSEDAIILTTLKLAPNAWALDPNLPPDAYQLKTVGRFTVIAAANDRGVLYGTFALLLNFV